MFDDDFLGTGFLPFVVTVEVAEPGQLPDVDSNGVPDVLEVNLAAALPEASPEEFVRTGLAGRGGCVIGTGGGAVDPLLALLAALAAGGMIYRRRPRRSHG